MAGQINSISGLTPSQRAGVTKTDTSKELFDMVRMEQTGLVDQAVKLPDSPKDAAQIAGMLPEEIKQAVLKQISLKVVSASSEALKKLMDMIKAFENIQGLPMENAGKMRNEAMLVLESLPDEMLKQNQINTLFKGSFFDVLRNIMEHSDDNAEIKTAVADFLRAYNAGFSEARNLETVNGAVFMLFQQLMEAKDFRLANLIRKFMQGSQDMKQPDSQKQADGAGSHAFVQNDSGKNTYQAVKSDIQRNDVFSVLKEILLKYPENEKIKNAVAQIAVRYVSADNDAENVLIKSFDTLMQKISESGKDFLGLKQAMQEIKAHLPNVISIHAEQIKNIEEASILDKLLLLMSESVDGKQGSETVKAAAEQVLRGMMVSNLFKEPVLHFLFPIKYRDTEAYGEVWVNPDEKGNSSYKNNGFRFVLSLDIDGIGHFEGDATLRGKRFSAVLYCPPGISEEFSGFRGFVTEAAHNAGFWVDHIDVAEIKQPRTLEEAFQKPLERRMELDARV